MAKNEKKMPQRYRLYYIFSFPQETNDEGNFKREKKRKTTKDIQITRPTKRKRER